MKCTIYLGLKTIAILFLIAFGIKSSYGQTTIKAYAKQKSTGIKTIEPSDENYDDLKPIGQAIGDSKVVMLGEQGHGDGTTFLAKSRIVKYLHEQKGFDILAFECDFFGLNKGWDALKKQQAPISDFILRNIFLAWSGCTACHYLFDSYEPNTYKSAEPLIITGFDCHQQEDFSSKNLPRMLDSVIKKDDLPITKEANYSLEIKQYIHLPVSWEMPESFDEINHCVDFLMRIRLQLIEKEGAASFWALVADNLVEQANDLKDSFTTGKTTVNNRDAQMAKNLAWLINTKYKGRKIIVWAANSHVARSLNTVNDTIFKNAHPMTEDLIANLPNKKDIYVLGFTSFVGTARRIGRPPQDFKQSGDNNVESWIHERKYSFAFLDFSGFNSENIKSNVKFSMALLGHISVEATWNRMFDGIFYIEQMYPCVPLEHLP